MSTNEMSNFDALVMDYLEDELEPTLAEKLHLRSVNAVVDWYSEEKSVAVDAWQLDLDHDINIRFTESDRQYPSGQQNPPGQAGTRLARI